MKTIILLILINLSLFASSGGPLSKEQAAYDVKYYHLDIGIDVDNRFIAGSLLCEAVLTDTTDVLVLDLHDRYEVDSIYLSIDNSPFAPAMFNRTSSQIAVNFKMLLNPGSNVKVKIFYWGVPRTAINPPWGTGFVWAETAEGKPIIGVASEEEGADLWWPCKDHPSDEPDSMRVSFTVKNPLQCISNGRLESIAAGDSASTYNWFISTPINNYNVTFYIAEFNLIEEDYTTTAGGTIPFKFWVLPQNYNKALAHMPVFKREFDFLEQICGPFPFGMDKHGFAEAPYWGMEHQTIIAYGHDYSVNSWGFDYIHYHELAHEWWGNLVTAKDWSDVWIHEGIATYTEALIVEQIQGIQRYHQYIDRYKPFDGHFKPLAPREAMTAGEAFDNLNPYYRGLGVLHTLRWHLGDTEFFKLLKHWAYPVPGDYDNTGGRLCRIADTDDMKLLAEQSTGRDLDPFFEVFFRQAPYPKLKVTRGKETAQFEWVTLNDVPLDVDVAVKINGTISVIEMNKGKGSASIPAGAELIIDPERWLLMGQPTIITSAEESERVNFRYNLEQNYPNPFNPVTSIKFSVAVKNDVKIRIFDSLGSQVDVLMNEVKEPGEYSVNWNASDFPSGVYYCRLSAGSYNSSVKLLLLK